VSDRPRSRTARSLATGKGPSLPDIKRTSIETILNGVGPHRYGQWPRCEEEGCAYQTSVVCPKGHAMLVAHNRMECMLYLVTGQRALYRGGDNPDNLRGMAAAAAWIDEITLCHDPQILPVVQGRLLDLKGRLRFTGTPKGKNWLWQDVMQTLTEVEPGRVWRSARWYLAAIWCPILEGSPDAAEGLGRDGPRPKAL